MTKRRLNIRGLRYCVETVGTGTPLLALHGFTGRSDVFAPFFKRWSETQFCIAPDLPGHGETDAPADANRYTMEQTVEDLVSILDDLGVVKANVLGYSMGGRIALAFAIYHPDRVQSLVLEGASPGLATAEERAVRVASDIRLAESIEASGVHSFVRKWEEMPIFSTQKSLPESVYLRQRAIRESHTPTGLANSLRGVGTGQQQAYWTRLREVEVPVLLVTGSLDKKFTEINRKMNEQFPQSEHRVIPNAGHTPHLEMGEQFAEVVESFLFRYSENNE